MLWADGTTLGADNGIAVAMMLALLETEAHPTLECLFTVEEETGLAGAKGFDCSCVTAKKMINLDSEEDWQITAGCAGGCRTEADFVYKTIPVFYGWACLDISLTGLSGGHSGAEIHCGKTNAIIAMGRLLGAAYEKVQFNIVSITCNGKDNAIARECFATVATDEAEAVKAAILAEAERIRPELSEDDKSFSVSVKESNGNKKMIDSETTANVITFLSTVKTGVLKMSNQIKGLVEYSRNIGVVETDEEKIKMTLSSRSSVEAQLDLSCRELDMLCSALCADCHHYARYPGWEYAPVSPLRDSYSAAFKELYGKELSVGVIHAGLECGILSSKMNGMDIISIGPNMYDIHSPCEHLDLASCERVWKTLIKVITTK
jgi:dipeptidase D